MEKGLFKDRVFNHKLIALAFPLALQSLMLAAVAAADAIMLGVLEQNSMSAVSLATQVQFIMNIFLAAVTSSGSILGAQYWGKGDRKALDLILNMMLRILLVMDLFFGAICIFIPGLLMTFFTNVPAIQEIGIGYLRIAGLSYLIVGISQGYQTVMKITDHARSAALISSSTVILNIALNAVFIFGLFGFPSMGARGAALATLTARIVELIWSVLLAHRKDYVHPELKNFFTRNVLLGRDFWKICLPLLGGTLLWGVGFTSYTAIMGHLGEDAAAANSVAAVVRDLTCCMCNGIGSAAAIMLGNELGQGNMDIAKSYGTRLAKLSVLVGLVTMAVVLALIPAVLRFYKLTSGAEELLTGMLVITSIYMIGRCINTVVINGVFDGGGDTKFDMYSLAVMMWAVAIPCALLAAFVLKLPILVVYACTCLDEVGKLPWVLVHFRKYKWLKNLTRSIT